MADKAAVNESVRPSLDCGYQPQRRLRILQTIRTTDPVLGGSVQAMHQTATVLRKQGHVVHTACLDSPQAAHLSNRPEETYTLGRPGSGKYGYSPLWVPWMRENARSYDLVIIHGIWAYHSLGTWRVLRNNGVPYVVFTHGMLDPWFKRHYPAKHLKKWLYWPWAEYQVLRGARAVLSTCEEERILAQQSFWLNRWKERVVPLGIPAPDADPDTCRGAFFRQFPHLRGKRLVLFLSRLHAKKGCDLLVEAYAEVLGCDDAWHLVMAGPDQSGWMKALAGRACECGISEHITWTGMLSGELKWGAFCAADVFALPSHSENFGFVVAEALACGVPVLISDKVNIWREVERYDAGFVRPDTLRGTIDLLRAWHQAGADRRNMMRGNAKQCFSRHFEMDIAGKRFHETLSELLRT